MDRFDLEQLISRSWTCVDDIEALITRIQTTEMPKWKLLDTLKGVKNMHDLRTHQLFTCYEKLVEEGVFKEKHTDKSATPAM